MFDPSILQTIRELSFQPVRAPTARLEPGMIFVERTGFWAVLTRNLHTSEACTLADLDPSRTAPKAGPGKSGINVTQSVSQTLSAKTVVDLVKGFIQTMAGVSAKVGMTVKNTKRATAELRRTRERSLGANATSKFIAAVPFAKLEETAPLLHSALGQSGRRALIIMRTLTCRDLDVRLESDSNTEASASVKVPAVAEGSVSVEAGDKPQLHVSHKGKDPLVIGVSTRVIEVRGDKLALKDESEKVGSLFRPGIAAPKAVEPLDLRFEPQAAKRPRRVPRAAVKRKR